MGVSSRRKYMTVRYKMIEIDIDIYKDKYEIHGMKNNNIDNKLIYLRARKSQGRRGHGHTSSWRDGRETWDENFQVEVIT